MMNLKLNQLFFALLIAFSQLFSVSCNQDFPAPKDFSKFPPIFLWAWEKNEKLDFLDSQKFGVAFLSQTLVLENDDVVFRPRRQPLKVSPETVLIAVTRIETKSPSLSKSQLNELITLILKTSKQKNVSGIQIDFDAKVSERKFYRQLLETLRPQIPADFYFSVTALASFCIGDLWIENFPVDEAVPMVFRMGADNDKIKSFLAKGNDFELELCRKSYGMATDEPLKTSFEKGRRIFVFKGGDDSWTKEDIEKIEKML